MECHFTVCNMKESLQSIFISMIQSNCLEEAMDFISMTQGQIPDYCVLSAIIYKVLMKTSDKCTAVKALRYLMKFLDIYPPSDCKTRKFYYEALCKRDQVQADLWNVTADIIRFRLSECGIYPRANPQDNEEAIKNSDFLLQYIVNVFILDFEHFSETRFSHSRKSSSFIAKLFWPYGEISSIKSNCEQLLVWINDVYKHPIDGEKIEVLELLHKVMDNMAKFCTWSEDCSDAEAVCNQHLDKVAQKICRLCCDVWRSSEKLRLFLSRLSLRWLRIKICENLIHKTINSNELPYNKTAPLTLRKIVRMYMFPIRCKKGSLKFCSPIKDATFNVTKSNKANISRKNITGETSLHKACRLDKPGTLAQLMRNDTVDVNVRDNCGWTPLHEACWAKSYFCAYVLCTGISGCKTADLKATNDDGLTPLHCAAIMEEFSIAEMLLEIGGPVLLNLKDNEGKTPADIAQTPTLKQLFQECKEKLIYVINASNFYNTDANSTWVPPCFKNYEFYSIYLQLLNFLLCDYIEIFQLHRLKKLKENHTLKETVKSHLVNDCCFVQAPSTNDIVSRCDDLLIMQQMPEIIKTFLEALEEQPLNKINISVLVMPFMLLASSF